MIVAMATVYIPEAEAVRDLPGLLARVRAGEEIVIEKEASSPVVLRVGTAPRGRLLSESIALAEADAKETGFEPVMDAEFAADLEEIIRNRKPRDTSAWD
jgi:antitoxin (DNA-binding transcriptional repressor) of toxin-antitoxin stability system